jgi:hypothetical protein
MFEILFDFYSLRAVEIVLYKAQFSVLKYVRTEINADVFRANEV